MPTRQNKKQIKEFRRRKRAFAAQDELEREFARAENQRATLPANYSIAFDEEVDRWKQQLLKLFDVGREINFPPPPPLTDWPEEVVASFPLSLRFVKPRLIVETPALLDSQTISNLPILSKPIEAEPFQFYAVKNAPNCPGRSLDAWYNAFRTNAGALWETVALKFDLPCYQILPTGKEFQKLSWLGWIKRPGFAIQSVFLVDNCEFLMRVDGSRVKGYELRLFREEKVWKSGAYFRCYGYRSFSLLNAGDSLIERDIMERTYSPWLSEECYPIKRTKEHNCVDLNNVKNCDGTLRFPLYAPKNWARPEFANILAFRDWPAEHWDYLITLIENRDIREAKSLMETCSNSEELRRLLKSLKDGEVRINGGSAESAVRPKLATPWSGPGTLITRGPFFIYEIPRKDPSGLRERKHCYLLGAAFYGFALRIFDTLGVDTETSGALGFIRSLTHGASREIADKMAGTLRVIPHSGDYPSRVEEAITSLIGPPLPLVRL